MDFDFSTRLSWFDANHYQYGYRVIVTEPAEEGKAEVTFVSSKKLLSVKTTEKNALVYIKFRKVADGTVLEFINEFEAFLHIVECKKTIKEKSWSHVIKQFQGGLINAMALAGVIGVQIRQVTFYTAYREDKLSAMGTSNPVFLKLPTGEPAKTPFRTWQQNALEIEGRRFKHAKTRLDSDGLAEVSLSGLFSAQ